MGDEFGKQINLVFTQWESDIQKSKDSEEKLEVTIYKFILLQFNKDHNALFTVGYYSYHYWLNSDKLFHISFYLSLYMLPNYYSIHFILVCAVKI